MAKPTNQKLYDRIKKKVYKENTEHSAYRSGQIVKQYKAAGGTYEGKKTDKKGLGRWFDEEWKTEKGKKTYKEGGTIFRPTKKITKDTPKTMGELTKAEKDKAIKEKKAKGRVKKY